MNGIRFYKASGKYGFLSNLWKCVVVFAGRHFPSAEHAYQFGKPVDSASTLRDWMMRAPNPSWVARIAHNMYKYEVRADWNQIKVARMREVLRAKFEQNPDLAAKLVATGDAVLVEASTTDAFWGIGKRGKGQNMLGRVLMELREDLKRGPALTTHVAPNEIRPAATPLGA